VENNCEIVLEELRRQFDITERAWDSLDHKIEILIGGTLGVVGYLLFQGVLQNLYLETACGLREIILVAGLGIMISLVISYLAYRTWRYNTGVNVEVLYDKYIQNSNDDFKKKISGQLKTSIDNNRKNLERKSIMLNWATYIFMVSSLILMIIKFYGIFSS
jgi:hypothetical protein